MGVRQFVDPQIVGHSPPVVNKKFTATGGYRSSYLYTKGPLVKKGDRVAAGQPIAAVGKAGTDPSVAGAVLGFGVFRNHEPVDPISLLPPQ